MKGHYLRCLGVTSPDEGWCLFSTAFLSAMLELSSRALCVRQALCDSTSELGAALRSYFPSVGAESTDKESLLH